ncbi:MAG: benzoate-CoA ligase family protein [Phycisphaerae bacterium]|nr:benzoate-CoA ligase family protein [Phycisphaerae bacterium]
MSANDFSERLNAAAVFVDSHIPAGRGDKPAILCGDETVTYRRLCENVNRFGNALISLGIRMEERVAIMMPDCPDCVYAFFGAIKIGAVAIPMNTILLPGDYEYLLNDSRARVLVVHPSLLSRVEEIRTHLRYLDHIIVSGEGGGGHRRMAQLMDAASAVLAPADTTSDDAAFWLYSSGTTGFPKGAIHLQHDMIVAADLYARDTIGLTESDVCFSVAKLFFAYGLGNGLYFPLRVGATTVLLPDRPTPDAVYSVIDKYKPTVFYGVPTSYASLLHAAEKADRQSLGRVRMCVSAGEPLPKTLFEKWLDRFGVEILDGIGSTEILHIFISNRPGQVKPGSTGRVVEGYEAMIVDDDGRPVGVDVVGTLLIKGDSIAAGYWNKHKQTRETFRGEWINTHDKFSMDEDGCFWYAGRADDMFKVSGLFVWPTDVESVLISHPAVLESGVVGVPNAEGLIKPRAYVVLKDKSAASETLAKDLQTYVKTNASPHKYPRTIIFVDSLPKTATGKIQRYKLREQAAAGN